jgi:hypothetical protein
VTRGAAPLLVDNERPGSAADTGVKDMQLVPSAPADGLAAVIERLAANPDVDVVKLEKIIELQERIMRHNSKAAFDGAFAKMQAVLPEIDERGQILVKGQLRSTYAKLEDIHRAIKPVLKEHGFAIRHRTEWPSDKPGIIRIVGILSHEQGHSEESAFEAKMDQSDYRTDIQSQGSTVSYGRRYTTLDLLNISTRGMDDDGRKAGRETPPDPPQGFADWWSHIQGISAKGQKPFEAAWETSDGLFKNYAHQWCKDELRALKLKAAGK